MNIKKIVSLLIALILTLPFIVSCGKDEKTVMTISGFDVPYHVYRYIVINSQSDIENTYGKNVWESDDADEAKAELAENIKVSLANLYTVCALGADFDLTLDDDAVSAQAELERDSIIGEYENKDEFAAELEALAMTEDTFLFIISNDILNNEVYSALIDSNEDYTDKDYLTDLFNSDDFIRVKQILVGGENAGTDEQNMKKAKEIKAKLDAGEDFDTLCREYNNDLYMFENDDGYYIMRGTRNYEFEEAAFALEIGEVSDIVKTDAGYSIIKRYEKEDDYITENFDTLADEYYESMYTVMYEERYEQVYSSITSLPEDYDITTLE